jgi:hypothetical protein
MEENVSGGSFFPELLVSLTSNNELHPKMNYSFIQRTALILHRQAGVLFYVSSSLNMQLIEK